MLEDLAVITGLTLLIAGLNYLGIIISKGCI